MSDYHEVTEVVAFWINHHFSPAIRLCCWDFNVHILLSRRADTNMTRDGYGDMLISKYVGHAHVSVCVYIYIYFLRIFVQVG